MGTSKKYSHCLGAFDEIFVTLHLRCALFRANRRHTEDERQTLGYLILKIWKISIYIRNYPDYQQYLQIAVY